MTSSRRAFVPLSVIFIVVLLCAGAAAVLTAAPAHALPWEPYVHSAFMNLADPEDPANCAWCHATYPVTDVPQNSACTQCHGSTFKVKTGQSCWQCHKPGQVMDTSSAGCSTTCHILAGSNGTSYNTIYSHGTTPHYGADTAPCGTCHSITASVFNANNDPHHDTVDQQPPSCTTAGCHPAQANHDDVDPACTSCHTGMNIPAQPAVCNQCHEAATFGSTAVCTDCHSATGQLQTNTVHTATPSVPVCSTCHAGYQQHAGKVACSTCHAKVTAFHHGTSATAGKKNCTSCHAMRHAGKAVSSSKCSTCHKGSNPKSKPRVQHSSTVRKLKKCGACHSKQVHADAVRSSMTCQTCHKAKFHARQPNVTSSRCLTCHGSARYHAVGYACTLCHKSAVHDRTPNAGSH